QEGAAMRVSDVMTRFVRTVESTAALGDAARVTGIFDIGAMPVVADGQLVGIVTERDLCVRGMGEGRQPGTMVKQVMSVDVKTCGEEDLVDDVLDRLGEQQVRRMPVCSRFGELVGLVSLVDLARCGRYQVDIPSTLRDICRAEGFHSQRLRVA